MIRERRFGNLPGVPSEAVEEVESEEDDEKALTVVKRNAAGLLDGPV